MRTNILCAILGALVGISMSVATITTQQLKIREYNEEKQDTEWAVRRLLLRIYEDDPTYFDDVLVETDEYECVTDIIEF